MSMNFVTFNQDYSHLAVGEYFFCAQHRSQLKHLVSNITRLPNIHDRSLLKMLRVERRQHLNHRNALLDLTRSSHTFSKAPANS